MDFAEDGFMGGFQAGDADGEFEGIDLELIKTDSSCTALKEIKSILIA